MINAQGDRDAMPPEELQRLLDKLGLSHAALAQLIGADRSTPYKWASGEVKAPRWLSYCLPLLAGLVDVWAILEPRAEKVQTPPERLSGLPISSAELSPESKKSGQEALAFIQQVSTMREMDKQPMTRDAFKEALQALGWNQSEFARRMDLTVGTVSRWAHGSPIPGWVPVVLGTLLTGQKVVAAMTQLQGLLAQSHEAKANGGP
jgi:transcriptional regulator with XRE-family HTH domain